MELTPFLVIYIFSSLVLLCPWGGAYQDYDQYLVYDYGPPKTDPASKNKVEMLGPVLKRHVQALRGAQNRQIDIVFLVDSSASVGMKNFLDELKFVRKLLADFTVDSNHTRVAVVTFSSRTRVLRQVDYIASQSGERHKCSLLDEDLPSIKYVGGGTYTLGAILEAKEILQHSRSTSQKAVFLITDGFSNGGDPRFEARLLRESGVKMFTFGIRNGNVHELLDMASEPKNETCYILDSFEEFEALARRALHEDLRSGSYLQQADEKCRGLCNGVTPCCDSRAICRCGTHTGTYECACQLGYYGSGVSFDCHPCPSGTYKSEMNPGDVSSCKKCPDENHITEIGSTDISDCTCKRGFRDFNTSGCAALRCPALQEPKNGFFVNSNCENVFNAACGITCNPGYELRGTSLRICQDTGEWSGQPAECILKTCPALPKPKNGNMICDRDDFSFSTVCRFTCDSGYKLVGSRKRECLAISFWTGITSRCREITCHPLPPIGDGNISPAMCTDKEVIFGTVCQIECHQGYTLKGNKSKQCTTEGLWTPSGDGFCEDASPPIVLCPRDISVVADDEESTANVTWDEPVTFDNSGVHPNIKTVPVPPELFPIGLTFVKYIAVDSNGNRAKCRFSVEVKDVTPPRVDRCYSPGPFVSSSLYANVTWEEPVFSDNSEENPKIERSHAPGLFPRGKTIVTYTAFDESGNNSTCDIEITVIAHPCQYPPEPINGRRKCRKAEDGVYCKVACMRGYAFAISPAEEYYCHYDNKWGPEENLPIPDCSVQTASNGIIQPASITFLSSVPCRRRTLINHIEQTIEVRVSQRVNELCAENVICEVEDMQTTCEEEEDFNVIRVVLGRRKRRDINEVTEVRRVMPRGRDNARTSRDSSLTFDFKLRGQMRSTGDVVKDFQRQDNLTENFEKILTTINTEAKRGVLDIQVGGATVQFSNMSYDTKAPSFNCKPGSILLNTSCVQCPRGSFFNVISEECEGCSLGSYQPIEGAVSCLVCPTNTSTNHNSSKSQLECKAKCLPGTFSPTGLERCATCERGFYQPEYGKTECLKCPPDSTTWKRGARGIEKCKEYCPQGYVSKTGLTPCYPCPRGTYQPDRGTSFCYECLRGATTQNTGSTDVSDCQGGQETDFEEVQADESPLNQQPERAINDCFSNQCQNGGTCESQELGYTCNCVPGYKGNNCEEEINECEGKPCLNNGTCKDLLNDFSCTCHPGYQGKKCEVNINECLSAPCNNNGTCVDLVNNYTCNCLDGFEGPTCAEVKDLCESGPCMNDGSCRSLVGGYECSCMTGFEGSNCEINIQECSSSPCDNGATCVDGIGTFRCLCAPGYTGKQCQTEIDECASSPCPGDATCVDKIAGFVCRCTKGFAGDLCETELDNGYMLDFPAAGTFNYSSTTIDQDLTALTASFWMRTDAQNQGTPFSYASSDQISNALTITNYQGFVIYINDKSAVTDVEANDGEWHHIVFTWSANRGAWKIYFDSLSWDSGENLAAYETIKGGGTMVVGQEQDPGGVYSSSEAFVGQITRLNIWDEELPLSVIENMRVSCDKRIGNVIAWPDLQMGLHGSLVAEPSNFCRGCQIPSPPTNGNVNYADTDAGTTASYVCKTGYFLTGRNNRVCLITGDWEGYPPNCLPVDCGYPGAVDNGFVEGNRFQYDSRVRYKCEKGYRLIGDRTLYCNSSGEWEGQRPVCQRISCLLPLLSNNTVVVNRQNSYFPGDVAAFSCTPGNRLFTSHDSVACQGDGSWDKSVPTCDPEKCRSPPDIDNGKYTDILPEYGVGHAIQYQCDDGYEFSLNSLNPTGVINCLPTGQWESNTPQCSPVSCPVPPNALNAQVTYDSLQFGSSASYRCNDGYVSDDFYDEIVCTVDGTWDQAPPSCRPVDCGDPGDLANGIVRTEQTTFGSYVTYQCNPGYSLLGSSSRGCQSNSTWGGNTPVCEPVSCGVPFSINNGFYFGREYTFGKSINYACDEGYNLVGESESLCTANGRWSIQRPRCRRKDCKEPPPIAHGSFTEDRYVFEDTVTYQCDFGYEIVENDTTECLSDSEWKVPIPACAPISCGEVDVIENGNFTSTSFTFGGMVEFYCDEGYVLKGESIRICQPYGYWSGAQPTCEPGKCKAPTLIENGKVDYKDLSYKSVVIYSCDSGYTLSGLDVRRCQQNLTLSGEEPVCVPKACNDPGHITHGTKFLTGLLYNSIVSFQCDTGYILRGDARLTCTSSGEWSGNVPTCEIVECESPSRVTSNGRMIGDDFTYGATISYECDPGYNLVGSKNRTCQEDGEWDEKIPICEIVQCRRPTIRNGLPSGFRTEYGTIISFSCRRGYALFGPSERKCLENGTWSGPESVCVKCDQPPYVNFGTVSIRNSKTAIYQCYPNFILVGNSELECQINGSWNATPPRCEVMGCNNSDLNIQSFRSGTVNVTGVGRGSVAEYTCERGHTLLGESRRQCSEDGSWSGSAPICLIVTCPGSFSLRNGRIIGGNYTYLSNLTFRCLENYRLVGEKSITCQENGLWSGTAPVCEEITCPPLGELQFGKITVASNSVGSEAIYTCNTGYEIRELNSNQAKRSCASNGLWSNVHYTCDVIRCPNVSIENGIIIGASYTIGSQIRYECDEGYRLSGIPIRICLYSKMWSGPDPQCLPVQCPRPPSIENGLILDNGRTSYYYGDMIQYTCKNGYILLGNTDRTCQSNMRWSGSEPACSRVSCSGLPVIENAETKLLNSTISFGDMAAVDCNEGYRLSNNSSAISTCNSDGFWSKIEAECLLIQCPLLPSVTNGRFSSSNLDYNTVITLSCDLGYRVNGQSSFTCLSNAKWSAERFPTCNIVLCSEPTLVNGIAEVEGLTYGSEVVYSCRRGYEITGSKNRTCNASGAWTGIQPFCKETLCHAPPVIPYGGVHFLHNHYTPGVVVKYECDRGYRPLENDTMTCSSKGQWEGVIPRCVKVTCARPVSPRNGRVVYNDISFGNNISFACNPGFELRGSAVATCLETGLYSNDAPSCFPVNCGSPGSVPHAYVIGDSYIFGSVLTYFCEEGYDLIGDDNIVCLETARWSGAPPICSPVSCGRPPEINNARRMGDEFTYKRMVFYTCEKGYELSGNNLLECGADGDWIGSQPTCLPVTCGPPPVLRFSTTIVSKRTFGSTVTYICNEGYLLQGDMMTKCSENGSWLKDPNTACVPIDCGNPPLILQGTRNFSATTFQSIANYTCNPGYSLNGNYSVRCTATGSWSGDLPTCTRSSCQVPSVSNGMTVIRTGLGIGDSVEYKCPEGHIIVGEAVSECTSEGTWSSESPRCQHVSCGSLRVVDTSLKIVSGRKSEYSYNDIVQFFCDEGYTLVGEGNMRCLKTGKWNGTLPSCQIINLKNCPRSTRVKFAAKLKASQAVGNVVTIICEEGYEGIGDLTIKCLDDQTWTSPSGRCRRISCGKPIIKDLVNVVKVRGRSYFYGDKVYYRCRPGVRPMKIPPVLTCTARKQWDGQIACSMPCKGGCVNGGRCLGLRGCKCPPGYGGKRCQTAICILPCLNGGSCIAPYKCSCPMGFTGSRCHTTICDPPCENGGYCIKPNKCQCQHGYALPHCKEKDEHDHSRLRNLPRQRQAETTTSGWL